MERLGLVWLNVGPLPLDAPAPTETNKMAHCPPLWQMEILVLPALWPVTKAVLPVICTEATPGLVLLDE